MGQGNGEVRVIQTPMLPPAFVESVLDRTPVSLGPRRTATPHEFYRYPARFSPGFAAAAITAFSNLGDTVLDPFAGGGTTVVEAMRAGRLGVGADLNPLARFLTRAKVSLLTDEQLDAVERWRTWIDSGLRLHEPAPSFAGWEEAGYFKDLDSPDTWRVRKFIAMALTAIPKGDEVVERFCRCVVLRTSQWALDMRSQVPSASDFRTALVTDGAAMMEALRTFRDEVADAKAPIVIDAGLPGLADAYLCSGTPNPSLVLTSPPYPGVYVNYHRWKLRGRREIPAPYWIANQWDGHGLAHYTMSARAEPTLTKYFTRLGEAFDDLRRVITGETLIVQVVGFNDPDGQLPRFLSTMSNAGLVEVRPRSQDVESDGRLWRAVPGRRWWTTAGDRRTAAPHTAREVVLFHRLR